MRFLSFLDILLTFYQTKRINTFKKENIHDWLIKEKKSFLLHSQKNNYKN